VHISSHNFYFSLSGHYQGIHLHQALHQAITHLYHDHKSRTTSITVTNHEQPLSRSQIITTATIGIM